ncbi:hypothetical protein [Desulfitobacterium hafniense]|uniref:hypothetical protein n=1 Tax=Desulfitobacterium hafniense TaxID=49338 RepID=UPI00059CC477|nr:hypothetical protein [Desulfitobacterium hafniense]
MKTKVLVGVLVLLLLGGIYFGLNAAKQAKINGTNVTSLDTSENSTTKKMTAPIIDDQEGLQVGAQWVKQEKPSSEQVFSINLNNHAINVDGFQFEGNVTVLLDDREIPIQIEVLKMEGSGHHLSAEIKVESPEFTEASPGSRLTLKVQNVYNTPTRSFTWQF